MKHIAQLDITKLEAQLLLKGLYASDAEQVRWDRGRPTEGEFVIARVKNKAQDVLQRRLRRILSYSRPSPS